MKVHLLKTILAPQRKPKTHLKTITLGLSSFTKALYLIGILTTTIGLSSCKKDPVASNTQTSETTYAWWDFDGEHYESKVNYICNECKPIGYNVENSKKRVFAYFENFIKMYNSTTFEFELLNFTQNIKMYQFGGDQKNTFFLEHRLNSDNNSDSINGSWDAIDDNRNKFEMVICDTLKRKLEFKFNLKMKNRNGYSVIKEVNNGHIIIKY